MKKLITIVLALLVVVMLGATGVFAASDQIPSTKTAVACQTIEYVPADGDWHTISVGGDDFATQIKTGEPKDLIIAVTAECFLATDVKIKGTGNVETSESQAHIEIRVMVEKDGAWEIAQPGEVVFADRLVKLKGLLWDELQVTPAEGVILPEQWIEIYEASRTANGFNFFIEDVGSGVHGVKVEAMVWASTDVPDPSESVGALIGKRTLVVNEVNLK